MILSFLAIISNVLSYTVTDYYYSTDRTRGLFFNPPQNSYIHALTFYENDPEYFGRPVVDIVYINGAVENYPSNTTAISLYHSNDLSLPSQSLLCIKPPVYIPTGGYIGILGGYVVDENTMNITIPYNAFNTDSSLNINGNYFTSKRLMFQGNILKDKVTAVSTDDVNPMGIIAYIAFSPISTCDSYTPPNPDDPNPPQPTPNPVESSSSSLNNFLSFF